MPCYNVKFTSILCNGECLCFGVEAPLLIQNMNFVQPFCYILDTCGVMKFMKIVVEMTFFL